MKVLDLFSGIGGFSLGLERAGMRTVAFCEIDPYCRKVLAKHWPEVPCYDDVTTLTAARLAADGVLEVVAYPYFERLGMQDHNGGGSARGIPQGDGQFSCYGGVDVICGGFPCQDISFAGAGAGLAGERSGLWAEYARIIGEVRPRYVIVENVAALLHRGLADVLGDLSEMRYDAEWYSIRAADVGAPHRRDRVWIIGYPNGDSQPVGAVDDETCELSEFRDVADADQPRLSIGDMLTGILCGAGDGHAGQDAAVGGWWLSQSQLGQCFDGVSTGLDGDLSGSDEPPNAVPILSRFLARTLEEARATNPWSGAGLAPGEWERGIPRVASGIPARVDRLRSLGNAVVPQIPEIIGRAIMAAVTTERLL